MPSRQRTEDKIKSDRLLITKLYLEGKWQHQIADILGLSRQQISYDLKMIHSEWRDIPDPALRELRNRELARIDNLERTYWETWEKSLLAEITTTAKE
jgi:transcriptional antiterminator